MTDAGPQSLLQSRQLALKVGKWLAGAGRGEEALSLLAAWAAVGPNDTDGQKLMAEALRLSPASPLAKQAFERMEGVVGDHTLLEQAIAYFNADALAELSKQMPKPGGFRRAQVGFNNNIKYRAHHFHIQTEDSGLDRPHIITHLFADGGRIIKSHKRVYASEVQRPDVAEHVRALMKGQQMEMAIMLREGKFDEVIEGKRLGGMETLEEPPRVDVKRMGGESSAAAAAAVKREKPKAVFRVQSQPSRRARASSRRAGARAVAAAAVNAVPGYVAPYQLVRRAHRRRRSGRLQAALRLHHHRPGGEVTLPNERFCHAERSEARLARRQAVLARSARRQRRVLARAAPRRARRGRRVHRRRPADPGRPEPRAIRRRADARAHVLLLLAEVAFVVPPHADLRGRHSKAPACSRAARASRSARRSATCCSLTIRSSYPQHCVVEEQAGVLILTDLDSRTGVFVRINGEQELMHGDELLVGRTRLKIEFLRRGPA